MHFSTTKLKAIAEAKSQLKELEGVKRLGDFWIDTKSCQCDCGQSLAYEVYTPKNSITIGVCQNCAK